MELPHKSTDETTLKEFQNFNKQQKEKYLKQIIATPLAERSLGQRFILKFYSNYKDEPEPQNKKFLEL